MLKKLFGFGKKEKKEEKKEVDKEIRNEEKNIKKKEEEEKKEVEEEKIPEIPEPDAYKVELISNIIYNNFNEKENNEDNFENQLSLIKEDETSNIIQTIKIYFEKEKRELNSIVISKNSLLINIDWEFYSSPKRIDLLDLNKSFLLKTNLIEKGFVYIITKKLLFISFFSNLFEKFIGFDKGKSKQEEIFIINEKQIFTKINSLDSYSGAYFPIFYIENNLIYLNGFINYQDKNTFLMKVVKIQF